MKKINHLFFEAFCLPSLLFIHLHCATPMLTVHLPKEKWIALESEQFARSTDGSLANFPTKVQLKAGKQCLEVSFQCENDHFVAENYLTEHNAPLYNQEVFEIFIAGGSEDPVQYLEVEINPNNAIWIGRIKYPSLGAGNDMSAVLVGHDKSGIRHSAQKGKNSWSGTLEIPWALISASQLDVYRVNFYHIVSKKSHTNKGWTCHPDDCEFLCWSSTMNGATPAFHRPKRFGVLRIE